MNAQVPLDVQLRDEQGNPNQLGDFLNGKPMKSRFSSNDFIPLEVTGLYWHFVDILWVFSFFCCI